MHDQNLPAESFGLSIRFQEEFVMQKLFFEAVKLRRLDYELRIPVLFRQVIR